MATAVQRKIALTPVYKKLDIAYQCKRYNVFVLEGGSRCFAPNTKVRMYDGRLKNIQDVNIGDKVMNMHGNGYNTVIDTHYGIDMMYRISQKRGMDYIVNSRHVLSLKQTRSHEKKIAIPGFKSAEKRYHSRLPYDGSLIHDISVSDYLNRSARYNRCYTGFKNTMIALPEKELGVDPYYLGLWLGDGTSCAFNEITNVDSEIISYCRDMAESLNTELNFRTDITFRFRSSNKGCKISNKSDVYRLGIEFKKYELINNKHIPEQFIYNSYENRLKLLAGLIDSDGCKTGRQTYAITQKNRAILEGVLEICRISGFYTNGIIEIDAKMKRKDGSVYESKAYSIEINHENFNDLNKYIKIERKKTYKSCDRNYYSTSISIEDVGVGEYYGFELDNSPYFLLEDGTVAHNSSKTHSICQFWIRYAELNKGRNKRVIVSRLKATWLTATVVKDFLDILKDYGLYDKKNHNKSIGAGIYKLYDTEFWFLGLDDEQRIHGMKSDAFWINEAVEASFDDYAQLMQRCSGFAILDYNPSYDEHWIYDKICKRKKTCYMHSTMLDNPLIPDNAKEQILSYEDTPENRKNGTVDKRKWEIYGLGKRATLEGLIFSNWSIVKEIPEGITKRGYGQDFGFTNDPTAIVDCAFVETTKILYIDEKCYRTHMVSANIISEHKKLPPMKVMSESADERLVKEIKNAGIDIYSVKKGPGSVVAGISVMQGYKICVTERSLNAIREFRNYTWKFDDKLNKFVNEVPEGQDDHIIDAARYWVMGAIMGRIKQEVDLTGVFY